jgi:hypothetical protein
MQIIPGLLLSLFVCIAACADLQAATEKRNDIAANDTTKVEMANVLFRYSSDLTVLVVALRGALLPTQGHDVPNFNEPASFAIGTDAAEIRMSMAQLSTLMNGWLLRSPKAQLKNLQIRAEGHQLLIHGTLRRGLSVGFQAKGDVGLTQDNRIRITVREVHAAGLPVKGVMDALGLDVGDFVSQKGLHGLSVDKDSFLIDPQTAFPPPQIHAKIASVRVSGQAIVLSFGQGAPRLAQPPARNYIALRGGSIRYGRDQMFHADLTMIDTTPSDPFDFYLGRYWCQMVGGTIKARPNGALVVSVPDYARQLNSTCRP